MVDVIRALQGNTAEIESAKSKIVDINEAINQQLDVHKQAVAEGTITGVSGRPSTVDNEVQQLIAQKGQEEAAQRRANTVDFENYSNQLLDAIKQKGAEREQQIQKINDINNGGVLTQIAGMFTIPYYAAKADNAGLEQAHKVQELDAVNKLMQSSNRTSAEIQTRVTEDTIAGIKKALAADQQAAASKAEILALQTGAAQVKELLGMSTQQVLNTVKQFEIGEAMDMRELRKEQMRQMIEHRAANQEERIARRAELEDMTKLRKLQLENALETAQGKKDSIKFINYALAQNGKTPLTEEEAIGVLDQLNKPGPGGDMLRDLYQQGLSGSLSNGKFSQGSTPMEALDFRSKINYYPTTEAEATTLSNVEGVMFNNQAYKTATNQAGKIDAANKAVMAKLKADQENISISNTSLAKPIDWNTMASSRAFQEDPVFKEFIGPSITPSIASNPIDPKDLFVKLGSLAKENKITPDQMVNFYRLYAATSIEMNNRVSGLRKLTGLQQTKFIAHLPQPKLTANQLGFSLTGGDVASRLVGTFNTQLTPVDALNSAALYKAVAEYLSGTPKEIAK